MTELACCKNVDKTNPMYGRKHTEETKRKISESRQGTKNPMYGTHLTDEQKKHLSELRKCELNGMWKNGKVGYGAIHSWVKRRLIKPNKCQKCNIRPTIDLANISGKYKRDLNDWQWMCRRCHMLSDGRMSNLKQFQVNGNVSML